MHRAQPSLIMLGGPPEGNNVVTILKELHVEPYRIIGRTSITVVTFFANPWILNLSHNLFVFCKIRKKYS
jgi:hypothetical protein